MNHTKRLLRIAEKILADVHFSTQQEFDEYLKNHPNYREDTKFYVNGVQVKAPPKQKKNGDSEKNEMTFEQKRLHRLAGSKKRIDRINAATDKSVHPATLDMLSVDSDSEIKIAVANNEKTQAITLEKMSNDTDNFVRGAVATNPNTHPKTLDKLSNDSSSGVKFSVATNPNTHQKTLDKLSKEKNPMVRAAVATNSNTHPITFNRLSRDEEWRVRINVAQNESAPEEILIRLRQKDKNLDVRESADKNLINSRK